MHPTTVSNRLLAATAMLQISSAAPLQMPVDLSDIYIKPNLPPVEDPSTSIGTGAPSARPTGVFADLVNDVSARNLRGTRIGTTSGGSSGESSEPAGSKSKTSGLLDTVEPFAASWLGKNIGDQIGGAIGLTSSETTSAAVAARETTVSTNKERRKVKSGSGSGSGSGNSGSSIGGSVFNTGKDLVTGTVINGASQIGGDYIADAVESAVAPASTTDTASAKQRRSGSNSPWISTRQVDKEQVIIESGKEIAEDTEGFQKYPRKVKSSKGNGSTGSSSSSGSNSGSSTGGGLWDIGKDLVTGTLLNGASQVGGDYFASGVESAMAPASTTDAASAQNQRRKVKSSKGSGSTGSSSSSGSNSGSSTGGGLWNIGKDLVTGTLLNGASQVGGDYFASEVESAMAPASTTEAAAARKRSSDGEEALPSDWDKEIRIGIVEPTILKEADSFDPEDSPSPTPTSIRAEKRKSGFGSLAKTFGKDVFEQGASGLAGDWLASEAESALGMGNSAATPTAAASQKRGLAGKLASKTGKKAASKITHDETKNKTDDSKDDFKSEVEDLKNKLMDFLSGDGDEDDSDSKMLRRSVAGALLNIAEESVQKRSSIPIDEPLEPLPSELEQRSPQGLFSLSKGVLKMVDHAQPDSSSSADDGSDNGNGNGEQAVNISMDVAKRSPEAAS
ncbi:hypothetical protein VMCG_05550 [Cytospora schulzeri]|uniref:Uncharacterized protein n=1 Tax=Cytospora schulzeri TaxID=448051 RepID=A0A423WF57_9PEZI|nr:hypothetical protein VMCG_05550 [Valsa malicola]